MRSALYYPHTTVNNVDLLKTALLMWDKLEFIVPYKGFQPYYSNASIARAMELIGKPRVPNETEKKSTHRAIVELVDRPLPPQFYFDRDKDSYEMYPQKLLPETWNFLRQSRLSGDVLLNDDYPTAEPFGLTIMSLLADCCAGSTLSRITDKGAAYTTLADLLTNASGEANRAIAPREQLIPITLQAINPDRLSIDDLIAFREREEKEGGRSIRDLRHRYVDNLETYVKRLTAEKVTASDAEEIKRQLIDDMDADIRGLRLELSLARRDAVLSGSVLALAVAATGSAATWLFGAAVPILGAVNAHGLTATVGGVLGALNKFQSSRNAIIQKHPMAYLYELGSIQRGRAAAMDSDRW